MRAKARRHYSLHWLNQKLILDALRNPDAAKEKQDLQNAAAEIVSNDSLIQAIAVYQTLSFASCRDFKASDLQFMAGQLNRSIFKMKGLDPAIAGELQKAYENLKADDVQGGEDMPWQV